MSYDETFDKIEKYLREFISEKYSNMYSFSILICDGDDSTLLPQEIFNNYDTFLTYLIDSLLNDFIDDKRYIKFYVSLYTSEKENGCQFPYQTYILDRKYLLNYL